MAASDTAASCANVSKAVDRATAGLLPHGAITVRLRDAELEWQIDQVIANSDGGLMDEQHDAGERDDDHETEHDKTGTRVAPWFKRHCACSRDPDGSE